MMIKLFFETNFYAKRDERMHSRRMHRRRKCVSRDRPLFDAFLKRERERSEREVISVLKMRENSREGKIRWIKFNCCAKQTFWSSKDQKIKRNFIPEKRLNFFFLDTLYLRERTSSSLRETRGTTTTWVEERIHIRKER